MAPDSTGALLFPVDCSRNFTSRIACVPHRVYNKSLDYKDESIQLYFDGYQTQQHKNSSVLKMSMQICPEGYGLGFDHTCLQLVRLPVFLPIWAVTQCSTWVNNYNFECEQVQNLSQQIIDRFNSACKMTDVNSSVYRGVSDRWQQESDWQLQTDGLNNYFLQVFPSTTFTFITWQSISNKSDFLDDASGCLTKIKCPLFPRFKQERSGRLNYLLSSRPFVLCAREPIMPPPLEVPVLFDPFPCADGSLIAVSLQCDGIGNCPNAEDEENCTSVCTDVNINCYADCLFPKCQCSDFYYHCIDGGCRSFDKFCNGQEDCPLGEDEQGCVVSEKVMYNVSTIKQDINQATGFCLGMQDSLPCESRTECYNWQDLCHYDTRDGIIVYCADGTHLGGHCILHVCNHEYKCVRSYCIPTHKVCDGIVDCPDADDEAHCDNIVCPGHLRCSNNTFCVPPHEICDGDSQCPLREDEKFCMLCPTGCFCRGTSISCNNVEQVNLVSSPAVLVLNNSFPVLYQFAENGSHFLESTLSLIINHGKIYEILQHISSTLKVYKSLRMLHLNNQGIQILYREFIYAPLLTWLDLSSNIIHSMEYQAFKELKSIEVLNVASNKLNSLKGYFFESLEYLKFLYLQGNPLIHIDSQILINSQSLRLVRSDWYLLCCAVHHVTDCKPKGYLVSSCESLLSFLTAKIFITIQAVFAIVVNGGVLVRLFTGKYKSPDRPLMISLVSADTMMGIYLLILSITDLSTSGAFHLYIGQWTQSYTCLAAGILNFVSSEASLCILAALSTVRSVAIQKAGGLKMMKKEIIYVSMLVWVFIFSLVGLYILAFAFGVTHLRNNMCIILGISLHHHVSVPEYAFQILLISLNSIVLVTVCVSALNILVKVYLSRKSVGAISGSSHSRGVSKIGAKLMLLLFFNFVCWIPILCTASIMLSEGNVHEDVLVWMGIFILPISATTDPFLYNLHLFKKEQTQK